MNQRLGGGQRIGLVESRHDRLDLDDASFEVDGDCGVFTTSVVRSMSAEPIASTGKDASSRMIPVAVNTRVALLLMSHLDVVDAPKVPDS